MKILFLMLSIILAVIRETKGQDLNTIDGSGFNIATSFTPLNAPENTVILGLQSQYDANYKWQLVNAHNTDNYYLRTYVFGWNNYYKLWHSGNFNPDNCLRKISNSISQSNAANNLKNGYTFAYATSGTPWNGALISFGGFTNNYDCQISSDYGPNGGGHISFRTKNGDSDTWNTWSEIWHSENLNKSDIDFNCKNLYANGNLWAKEIKIELTNPWPDYVLEKEYHLISLTDLETYIKTNKHLPEIPSGKEVKENGISLGEMNAKLLKKIEELTLYVIELKKENSQIKEDNKKQEEEKDAIKVALIKIQNQLKQLENNK